MCAKICAKIKKTYKINSQSCLSRNNLPKVKRKPRCLKLKYKKQRYMTNVLAMNGWTWLTTAPPLFQLT